MWVICLWRFSLKRVCLATRLTVIGFLFASMDLGSTNRPRRMVTQRTPSGLGFRYFHFNDHAYFDEILFICHAITLCHKSPVQSSQLEGTTGQVLDALRVTGTGTEIRWWPWREYVAVYLAFRTTSIASRAFAVTWYVSEVRDIVKYIVHLRGVVFQRRLELTNAGCVCHACKLEWLARGWECPRARIQLRSFGNARI